MHVRDLERLIESRVDAARTDPDTGEEAEVKVTVAAQRTTPLGQAPARPFARPPDSEIWTVEVTLDFPRTEGGYDSDFDRPDIRRMVARTVGGVSLMKQNDDLEVRVTAIQPRNDEGAQERESGGYPAGGSVFLEVSIPPAG